MKKNCGSRAVWWKRSIRSSMWRRDDSWGQAGGRVKEDECRKLGGLSLWWPWQRKEKKIPENESDCQLPTGMDHTINQA